MRMRARLRRVLAVSIAVGAVAAPGAAQAAHVSAAARPGPTCRPSNAVPYPGKAECRTAKKILTQWERLARKLGVKLSPKRVRELREKTRKGTIKASDLPATLRRQFPAELAPWTLSQIDNICRGLPPGPPGRVTV